MSANEERQFANIKQLSLRSIIIGSIGSCVITASSMYIALRMSSLPWPTIFVALLSMTLLKAVGKTTLNEINITQTAMSAGAMVAGGLAFTLPGLWITKLWKVSDSYKSHFWTVLLIALAGVILGSILTWILRPKFIENDPLPYPIGTAAAETITLGDKGGRMSRMLFGTMGFSAIFTYMRDSLGWIPAAITSKWLYAKNIYVGVWVSPMAVGIGYLIGTLYTGIWFLGAVISYLFIIPLGPKLGLFSSVKDAVAFKNTAGIGLMVGTGIGILISYIISLVKGFAQRENKNKNLTSKSSGIKNTRSRMIMILAVGIAFVLSVLCGLNGVLSVMLILGVFGASSMASIITGETGINPMEVFGIIVLLAIRLFVSVKPADAFLVTACVAVACGYAGDLLNEYKAGKILGTNPMAQHISQICGGVIGAFVASISIFAIIHQYGGIGAAKGLPAGQAFAVSQMVNGIGDPLVFTIAATIGAALYILRIPAMTLGIGMYLSFEISSAVFLGGLARFIINRFSNKHEKEGNVAASGLLGGEGITGVTVAIIKMITSS